MKVSVSHFWSPKSGNSTAEYEDAYHPREVSAAARWDRLRLAVADGATEGSYSRQWAELLARSYCRARGSEPGCVYEHAVSEWRRWLGEYVAARAAAGRPLQWFEEAKLDSGAFSTLLGVSLQAHRHEASRGGWWSALAVGDSCLFHLRGDRLLRAFPIRRSADFGIMPDLVATRAGGELQFDRAARRTQGLWQSGDTLFLATDALSAWFLGSAESGGAPWRALRGLGTESQPPFEEWLAGLRGDGAVRNDDVTLTRVELDVA